MATKTFDIDNGLLVTGIANVSGAVALSNTLSVTGAANVANTLTVAGGLIVGTNTNIDGNTLFVDATNNRVGVNTGSPTDALTVVGNANVTSNVYIGGNLIVVGSTTTTSNSVVTGAQIPSTDGVPLGNTSNRFDLFVRNEIVYNYLYPSANGVPLGNTSARFEVFANNVTVTNTINVGSGSINSTIYTGTSNNSTYLNGQPSTYYTNATNIITGTLDYARFPSNLMNTTANFTITGIHTHNANVVFNNPVILNSNTVIAGGVSLGGSLGIAGQSIITTGSGVQWGSPTASQEYRTAYAQWSLVGGGLITWNGSAIKWSQRVMAIPVEKTEFAGSGYIQIDCPTSGSVTYYDGTGSTTTATCTSNGIPLANGDALYYRVSTGMGSASDQTKFVVVNYQNASWSPGEGWLLLAIFNGDGTNVGHVKFTPAQISLPSLGSTVTYNVGTGVASWLPTGTVTSVVASSGLTGGTITATGTIAVNANTGIVSNATGVFVNSSYIATISANNASFLGGVAAANYVANSGNFTIAGVITFNANVFLKGVSANGGFGSAGQVLTSNASSTYWAAVNIPKTTSTSLTTADVGKCTAVSGTVTVPNATFAAGDAVSIYNDSASSITITASITTLRLAGTTTTGSRTLAARGLATIWFLSGTEAIISGAGVS